MDEDELESEALSTIDETDPVHTDPYQDIEADQPIWQNLGDR